MPVLNRAERSRTGVVFVALLIAICATGAAAREFRAADTQTEDYPTVQALRYMGALIAERSGGRHEVKVFHSRQLGEEKETIEQTRVGAIDLNRTNVALIGNFVPAMNVLAMPFLFRSIEHMQKVLDGPIGGEILGSFEPYGFVGLAFYDSGARSIYNGTRPVRNVADLKGLRIRVQQSELMSQMIRALGAEPVEMPYGQVLAGLANHLIDGAENNWPSYVTTDHFKHAGYLALTEHTMSPEVLVISLKAWKSLSVDDQTDLQGSRAALQPLHAREMARPRGAVAAQGGRSGRHHRQGYRPQAVRGCDGRDLRQGRAGSGRGRADRTHSQGGVKPLARAWTQRACRQVARPDRAAARAAGRRAPGGADPLAHPVDRGAELRRGGGAGRR